MADKIRIAIDAMGGDYAPLEPVKGAIKAMEENPNLEIIMVGRKDKIHSVIKNNRLGPVNFKILDTPDVITMSEHPVNAMKKKDSSLIKAMQLVKEGKADAVISGGNSGALIVGSQKIMGKIKGVSRPAFSPIMPTSKGPSVIIDSGGNVDARPGWLTQWASMGSIYMNAMFDIESPRVALINLGVEKEKGDKLTKETYGLLEDMKDINFVGNIEARNIPNGEADVLVCDAFVGNVILKMYEGVAKTLMSEIKTSITSSFPSKIGALLIKGNLKGMLKKYDVNNYGGSIVLGIKGITLKVHGNAKSEAFASACMQVSQLVKNGIIDKIVSRFSEVNEEEAENSEE